VLARVYIGHRPNVFNLEPVVVAGVFAIAALVVHIAWWQGRTAPGR
jgi:hypothetical protein